MQAKSERIKDKQSQCHDNEIVLEQCTIPSIKGVI